MENLFRVVVSGDSGVGKSYAITKALASLNRPFTLCGYHTLRQLDPLTQKNQFLLKLHGNLDLGGSDPSFSFIPSNISTSVVTYNNFLISYRKLLKYLINLEPAPNQIWLLDEIGGIELLDAEVRDLLETIIITKSPLIVVLKTQAQLEKQLSKINAAVITKKGIIKQHQWLSKLLGSASVYIKNDSDTARTQALTELNTIFANLPLPKLHREKTIEHA